jgi:hypothetical protein
MTDLVLRGRTPRSSASPSSSSSLAGTVGFLCASILFALGVILLSGMVAHLVDHLLRDAAGFGLLAVVNVASAVLVYRITRPPTAPRR